MNLRYIKEFKNIKIEYAILMPQGLNNPFF